MTRGRTAAERAHGRERTIASVGARLPRAVAFVALLTLFTGACGGEDDGLADEIDASAIIPNAAAVAAAENATPEPIVIEGAPVGTVYELEVGDCFNAYDDVVGEDGEIGDRYSRIECSRAHDAEIFHAVTHPADAGVPYPGRPELTTWANLRCYEAFREFVGIEYEFSKLELAAFIPEQANWDFGLYRTVTCYVHAPDSQLSGSMAGTGI